MTIEQQVREEEAAWRQLNPAPRRRRRQHSYRSNEEKLRTGQAEEISGRPTKDAKPRFVKVTSGIHVQTRGPLVLAKFYDPATGNGRDHPWYLYRLPGSVRIKWETPRHEILEAVGAAEDVGGPLWGITKAKEAARALIAAADGELGS